MVFKKKNICYNIKFNDVDNAFNGQKILTKAIMYHNTRCNITLDYKNYSLIIILYRVDMPNMIGNISFDELNYNNLISVRILNYLFDYIDNNIEKNFKSTIVKTEIFEKEMTFNEILRDPEYIADNLIIKAFDYNYNNVFGEQNKELLECKKKLENKIEFCNEVLKKLIYLYESIQMKKYNGTYLDLYLSANRDILLKEILENHEFHKIRSLHLQKEGYVEKLEILGTFGSTENNDKGIQLQNKYKDIQYSLSEKELNKFNYYLENKNIKNDKEINELKSENMTYSNGLKSVVSDYGTTDGVSPRKPFHLNFSFKNRSRLMPKSLMYGSLIGKTPTTATTFKCGGGRYDYKRISAFQSSKIQSGCEDCNSEDRFSLQVQHKLPFDMDTEVSQEAVIG